MEPWTLDGAAKLLTVHNAILREHGGFPVRRGAAGAAERRTLPATPCLMVLDSRAAALSLH